MPERNVSAGTAGTAGYCREVRIRRLGDRKRFMMGW
jgi:hypothetical protein